MAVHFERPVPILRMFSLERTLEFYVDYLGFTVDWQHRFEDGLPLYMQVSRAGLVLHLSEHHGDGSPGANIRITTQGLEALSRRTIAIYARAWRRSHGASGW